MARKLRLDKKPLTAEDPERFGAYDMAAVDVISEVNINSVRFHVGMIVRSTEAEDEDGGRGHIISFPVNGKGQICAKVKYASNRLYYVSLKSLIAVPKLDENKLEKQSSVNITIDTSQARADLLQLEGFVERFRRAAENLGRGGRVSGTVTGRTASRNPLPSEGGISERRQALDNLRQAYRDLGIDTTSEAGPGDRLLAVSNGLRPHEWLTREWPTRPENEARRSDNYAIQSQNSDLASLIGLDFSDVEARVIAQALESYDNPEPRSHEDPPKN